MATTKKKRVSKKNKASWRKHTDIKDVEDFLDEQRQEERIGTFSEKKDDELFQIDVSFPAKKPVLSEAKKRKANAMKPLRSFAALENTSKVQDPIVKRNHVKPKRSGRNIEEEILNPKSQKHIQANKDRSKFYEKLDKKLSKEKVAREFSKDIWKEEDVRDRAPGLKDDWISRDLSLYTLKNIGKAAIKVHDSIRHKTTKAKAFEPPHPGMSYNPSLNAHKDLINNVLNKEEGIIKTEKHLKRVTTEMFSKVTAEERDRLRMKEMSSGLPEEDGGEEQENEVGVDDGAPYKTVNPPVENKKKSKQKRRKQKEQKVISKELQKKKDMKKLRTDIHRIKKLKTEVEEESEQLNQLKKRRKQVANKKKFETKRLGRLKFKEPDVDVNMPEDIAGNLRNVKVETSLLVDRFKNFQKRNLLPTSVEVGKRKPRKIKRFTRSSHKEPGVSISKKKK